MTKNTNANANDSVSQRKRNANQPRTNVASQNNQHSPQPSKRGNKQQNQHISQTQNQTQNQTAAKSAPSATVATLPPTSTLAPAPAPVPVPIPLPTISTTPTTPQTDESRRSLIGFNSDDVDELLKNGYDEKALMYKPEQSTIQQQQKTGPWAQKPSSMSNGKDFWLELRKQVAVLQKGESTNKGG